MEIPYWVLLIVYLIGIGIFLFLAFFQLYHLIRFGFFDVKGKFYTIFFLIFTVVNLALTFFSLRNIDWFATVVLFETNGLNIPGL